MGEEHPYWCYAPHEIKYEKLDPGVREVVRFLVEMGFRTTDSGDGVSKGEAVQIPMPHVFIEVEPKEIHVACLDLVGCLRGVGIEVVSQTEAWMEKHEEYGEDYSPEKHGWAKPYIEATYDPVENRAMIALYNVTSDMVPQ